ncbi:MAG: nucleotidyltransferase domain-containing protein [Planctomycetes bacterium]|nr:nucleotidyltransferase domain-containing protein [Planctomycetota bacterium]
MRLIRKFAREIALRFHPEKIILFGSYAYGQPHDDSDVDILIVMPARNTTDMAAKIHFRESITSSISMFKTQSLIIMAMMTHDEYQTGRWKKGL